MADLAWGRVWPIKRRSGGSFGQALLRAVKTLRWLALFGVLLLLAWAVLAEMQTSYLQSRIFSRMAQRMTYSVGAGASDSVSFPNGGPYDERLGYADMPSYIQSLEDHHFKVTRQAQWSPELHRFVAGGGYAPYREKPRAGLELFDKDGKPLYVATYPLRVYKDFDAIPPLVSESLSFIEDRDLLGGNPDTNPAVEWKRFLLAVAGRVAGVVDKRLRQGGASTLAVQIEKFRHSPAGRTESVGEKLRQMVSASVKAYRQGRDTTEERRRIITEYLNTEPLGSWPGAGEIIGFREALWTWFGTEPDEADRVLQTAPRTRAELARRGEVYRQVLALLLSGRRPTYYLSEDRDALGKLTDRYLRMLAESGIISVELRDAALRAPLNFRTYLPPPKPVWYIGDKASEWLRIDLLTTMRVPSLYALDRLDLRARGTIDSTAQKSVTDVLARVGDRKYVQSLGLVGYQLLGPANPANVAWSVVLYERGKDHNYVRIHADSLNRPFDINSGAKLQLGSTAKLRTLVTYLDVMDELHQRLSKQPPRELLKTAAAAPDPLTKWAAEYLAHARDRSLRPMIDAAMQRRYSGSPQVFFTGGGQHAFANFEKSEDSQFFNVYDGFAHSVNNVFVRIMHDIAQYYIGQSTDDAKKLLNDPDDPQRMVYLRRFADQEGREYMGRFYKIYHGMSPEQALDTLARRTHPLAKRLAVVFDTVRPNSKRADLGAFLHHYLPRTEITDDDLWDLYREYGDLSRFSLQDRGYLAGVHPLELWLVTYMQQHPEATRAEINQASADARQQVYGWLFKSHNPYKQNFRIRELLEEDAFDRIAQDWHRQGYPFARLVPSYASAIGSSGDRLDALVDMMGVIVHDGVKVPTVQLTNVHFGAGTPYDTELQIGSHQERVFPTEIADVVRKSLLGVVAEGTARRVSGVYKAADGSVLPVGGKTGTGDNRFDRFGAGGAVISQRVVDRTATFVFFLGDRYFGTITAYVPGAVAAQYHFTSAMAVQMLKALQPQFEPLLASAPAIGSTAAPTGDSWTPPVPENKHVTAESGD